MADKGYSTVQLLKTSEDDDSEEEILVDRAAADRDLQFKEFTASPPAELDVSSSSRKTEPATLPPFNADLGTMSSDDDGGDDDQSELLAGEKKNLPFWTFEYYQAFFDVDTQHVTTRLLHSMFPSRQNFLLTKIRPNPDLYGPFWICATLIFTIAIFGNLSSYFAMEGDGEWKYDFHVVSISGGVIFLYASLIPTAVYGFLWWRGNHAGFSFLEIICVYGYSMAIFVPISVLWVINYDWLQWILVIVGVLISGSVLVLTFWTAVEDDDRKIAILFMVMQVALHFTLAVGFKQYFFKNNVIQVSGTSTTLHPVIHTTPINPHT